MGLIDRIKAHHEMYVRKMVEDPYHYPIGTSLAPLTVLVFMLYTINGAFRIAATTRLTFNAAVLLAVQLLAIGLAVGIFVMGTWVYDWRQDFANRHPTLYRGAQAWRGLLGALALGTVWVTVTTPEMTMPTTAAGTLPLWLFALIVFGMLSFISLSVSAIAHAAFVLFQHVNGRFGDSGGSLYT